MEYKTSKIKITHGSELKRKVKDKSPNPNYIHVICYVWQYECGRYHKKRNRGNNQKVNKKIKKKLLKRSSNCCTVPLTQPRSSLLISNTLWSGESQSSFTLTVTLKDLKKKKKEKKFVSTYSYPDLSICGLGAPG